MMSSAEAAVGTSTVRLGTSPASSFGDGMTPRRQSRRPSRIASTQPGATCMPLGDQLLERSTMNTSPSST
jgi:hypothetical protein